MRISNKGLRLCLVAAAFGAAAVLPAARADDGQITVSISEGKKIFQNGKESVSPCQSCHGENGLGMDAMQTPRLANVGYAYIVKQLTVEDRRNVAAYLNTLEMKSEPSDLVALKAGGTEVGDPYKGLVLVRYGVLGKAPACQSCHGYNGRGADPIYPAIGQQKYVYLVNQLKRWRDGSRANDPIGMMRAVAKNLSDEDIYNAAAYLSRAPKSTVGDGFVPSNQSVLENLNLVH